MSISKKLQDRLSSDEYVFNPAVQELGYIEEMTGKGMHPVCCKCGARLLHALTPAEAREKQVPPGICCPVNPRHCQVVVSFGGLPRLPDVK